MSSMHRSSPLRITLNTNVITGSGMCKVCTAAVHSLALSTRTLSQLWACVKFVPKHSIPFRSPLNTNVITALGMCKVCTEAVHSVALGTRTLSQLWHWACVKYVPNSSPFRSTWNGKTLTITALPCRSTPVFKTAFTKRLFYSAKECFPYPAALTPTIFFKTACYVQL